MDGRNGKKKGLRLLLLLCCCGCVGCEVTPTAAVLLVWTDSIPVWFVVGAMLSFLSFSNVNDAISSVVVVVS